MSELRDSVREALKEVFDPEIPVNIVDLGLIYEISEYPINNIFISMTVTSPHCPAAVFLPERVKSVAENTQGVNDVHVELIYQPAWTRERMTDEAKQILGY